MRRFVEEENGDAVREAKVLHASILCNGDETQKSWKPLLNTIFALSGSSEWFAQRKRRAILVLPWGTSLSIHLNKKIIFFSTISHHFMIV